MKTGFGLILIAALCLSFAQSAWAQLQIPKPMPETVAARAYKASHPDAAPEVVAQNIFIGQTYKRRLAWMREDLRTYSLHFDSFFEAKLKRIEAQQKRKQEDLDSRVLALQRQLESQPGDASLLKEIERIKDIHRVHAFIASYTDAADFTAKFVAERGNVLKSPPSAEEVRLMNSRKNNLLYVDTWAVPFFNTGTQTRLEAKANVRAALQVFDQLDLNASSKISLHQFFALTALFSRPEFDDLRRYKLEPFPTEGQIRRFHKERSDARTAGQHFPSESPEVSNEMFEIDDLSYRYGLRIHVIGIISHNFAADADGRNFTGSADFTEHDYAHTFFNLGATVPGTPQDWEPVHVMFDALLAAEPDLKLRNMMRLVYFHFTHESGFRPLLSGGHLNAEAASILELLHTDFYYELILPKSQYPEGYGPALNKVFPKVSAFFESHFKRIMSCENSVLP